MPSLIAARALMLSRSVAAAMAVGREKAVNDMLPAVTAMGVTSLVLGVTPSISCTFKLSSSATICAKPVFAFWPISMRAKNIRHTPSGRICNQAAPDSASGKITVGATEIALLRRVYSTVAPPATQPVAMRNLRREMPAISLPPA